MKKRFISMLLAVILVATLFGGTSVSAYADSDYKTFKYTIASGDTLLQICNNSGLNFYTCQTAINKLNNFTSEAQYRKLYVGQVITLPASNEDAAKIASSYVSGSTGSGSVVNTGSSTGSTGSVSGNVAYWLIPYTIQSGETITGVCNTLGISFSAYADLIKSINNISSWNRIPAGKTLLLPTAVQPAAGISCYAVIAHKVTQGETTYGICQNYGISYTANTSLLQTLNPKVSLTNIKYNTTLLVPVPTVITSGSTGGSSSGSNSGSSNSGSSSGSSNSGSSSDSGTSTKTYSISSSSSGGGSLSFTVNGKSATAAAAGSTVTIKTNPEANKTLDSISVTTADKSAVIAVSNGTFTMPESNVKVTATFGSGYIVVKGNKGDGSGDISCTVNNVPVDFAVKGATVKVTATPDAGSTLGGITVVNFSGKTLYSGLKSGDTFTMPGERVSVRAYFNAAATYGFTKEATTNGSFSLQVMGTTVTKAAAGSTVKVVTNPNTGYAVKTIKVTDDSSGQQINYNNSDTFTMPYSSVTVSVEFERSVDTYNISVTPAQGGTVSVGSSKSAGGKTITLTVNKYSGYELDYFTITYSGITEKMEGTTSFKMPYADVTITPVFKAVEGKLAINNTNPAWGTVTVADSTGKTLNSGDKLAAGSKVTVSVNVTDPGYVAIITASDGSTITSGSQVTVPSNGKLAITVTYDYKNYTLTVNNEWYHLFYLDIYVNGNHYQKIDITSKGQQVSVPAYATVQAKPVNSTIDGMTLNNELKSGDSITMPAANATLKVELTETGAAASAYSSVQEVPGVFGLAPELEG